LRRRSRWNDPFQGPRKLPPTPYPPRRLQVPGRLPGRGCCLRRNPHPERVQAIAQRSPNGSRGDGLPSAALVACTPSGCRGNGNGLVTGGVASLNHRLQA